MKERRGDNRLVVWPLEWKMSWQYFCISRRVVLAVCTLFLRRIVYDVIWSKCINSIFPKDFKNLGFLVQNSRENFV